MLALSVILREAERDPVPVGVNVMVMIVVAPPATTIGLFDDTAGDEGEAAKSPALDPARVTAVITRLPLPVLLTVSTCWLLVVFTA